MIRVPNFSDFREIRKIEEGSSPFVFVDKSLLIKDIIDTGDNALLFTRPRRFGKSTNLSMLYYYFSCTEQNTAQLFDGLKIQGEGERYAREQGKYPTILITLKDLEGEGFDEVYASFKLLIAACYERHSYLLDSEVLSEDEKNMFCRIKSTIAIRAEVSGSILYLSKWLSAYHGKHVVLLFDEYDAPIHDAYFSSNKKYYERLHKFLRTFFSSSVKENNYIYKCVLTGILQLAKADMFSGLSNVKVYTFLDKQYIEYFGFTEEEVTQLFKAHGVPTDLATIKDWYNGYHVRGTVLYNPWSILSCLGANGEVEPYWVNVGGNEQVKMLITQAGANLHEQLAALLQGKSVLFRLDKALALSELKLSDRPTFSLLYMAGYVNAIRIPSDVPVANPSYQLRIPNKEVHSAFERIIGNWIPTHDDSSEMVLAFNALFIGDISIFGRKLQTIAETIFSYYDTKGAKPECFYHGFLLGLVYQFRATYFILSNREAGDGRADIILVPKEAKQKLSGIILELKQTQKVSQLEKSAEEAYQQIEEKKYHQLPEASNAKGWIKVGIAFSGREVRVFSA